MLRFVGLRLCVTDKARTVLVQAGWSLQAMGFKLDDRFKLVFSEHREYRECSRF